MQAATNVIKGLLLARSPTILLNPQCTLLELLTFEGQKVKIVAANVDLSTDITCGKYYKFTNLLPRRIKEFDHVVFQLKHINQTDIEEIPPVGHFSAVDHQFTHSFGGKITAVDEEFGIYEVDDSKTLALSYLKQYCDCPTPQVGDEVEVKLAHLYTDRQENNYFVLCLRSHINIKSNVSSRKRERKKSSPFIQFVEAYGLSMECLLWLRRHQGVIKACINDTFLKSQGSTSVDVVYMDVLMMLLSTNEDIAAKIRTAPYKRNTLREFYSEPHSCLPLSIDCLRLPHRPLSLLEGLQPLPEMDFQNDDGSSWNFSISETQYNRPFLAYIGISKMSHRLSLMDGYGLEIPVVPVKGTRCSKRNLSCINEKIVLVERPLLVIENYTEEVEQDPAAEYIRSSKYKYICLMVELDDIQIFGPRKGGFSSWTSITVADFVSKKDLEMEKTSLIPLQKCSLSLDTFLAERYIVLHKTPLQVSNNKEILAYLMVKKVSSNPVGNEAGISESIPYVFFQLRRPHANFYDLIPSSGEIELRLPQEKADFIRSRRSAIPYTNSIKSKLKVTQSVIIPEEVEIYVVGFSRTIHADVYSISEAVNDPCCGSELVSITGVIANRSIDSGKFGREQRWFTNDRNFGLPGINSVLILDLNDPATNSNTDGASTRVFVSWQKSYQYPLGVLPGATVVVNFVYRRETNAKVYFRSTSLSSIEVVQLPKTSSCKVKICVNVPSGPWLFPHQLLEGASGWCMVNPRVLTKVELKAICKQCGELYIKGVCTYPGCSSPLGPKLSASARVLLEEWEYRDTLFVNDENVRVLLGISELEWSSFLVLADETGGVKYYKTDEAKGNINFYNLSEQILYAICENALNGRLFHCYCRRFKSAGHANVSSLFCILLQSASPEKALQVAKSSVRALKRH